MTLSAEAFKPIYIVMLIERFWFSLVSVVNMGKIYIYHL